MRIAGEAAGNPDLDYTTFDLAFLTEFEFTCADILAYI